MPRSNQIAPEIELTGASPGKEASSVQTVQTFYRINQKHPGQGNISHFLDQIRRGSGRLSERFTTRVRWFLSPSLRKVRAYSRGLDPKSEIAQLMPPERFDDVTKFITNYQHNSIYLNMKNLVAKAAGQLGLASKRPTVTELIAGMTDLENEGSELHKVLTELGPQIAAQKTETQTGEKYADLDVAAKLGGETLHRAMQLTDAEIAQQIKILHEIGDELRVKMQEIQAENEQAIAACVEGLSDEALEDPKTIAKLEKINKKTAKKINKMMEGLFDGFRKQNKAEIGYNEFTRLIAQSPSFHYYFWQLIYFSAINLPITELYKAFDMIPGVGPVINVVVSFLGSLPSNALAQISGASQSATQTVQRSLDPKASMVTNPANDIETYDTIKRFIVGLNDMMKEAAKQYVDPANDVGARAKARIETLAQHGYEGEALKEAAPLLSALAEYHHNSGPDRMGMSAYDSKPAMVADFIQKFADELPDINHLLQATSFAPLQKVEYVKNILEKIHQKYPNAPRIHDTELVSQILDHADKITEDVAPDEATLLAHDPALTEISEKIFEATKEFVRSSYSNKMFHDAQFQGLLVNTIVGAVLQSAVAAGVLAVSVVTHGAAIPFITAFISPILSYVISHFGATAGTSVWSKTNQKNISNYLMFQYLKERHTNPLLSDEEKKAIDGVLTKDIRSMIAEIHPQLVEQITKVTAAKIEDQAVKTRQRYYDDGASMAQIINERHGDNPSLVADLTAKQVALDRKLASTKNYRATLKTLDERGKFVDMLGNTISENFGLVDDHVEDVTRVADRSKQGMEESYGVKLALAHRKRYGEYYPGEDGVLPKQQEVDQLRKEFRALFDKDYQANEENQDFKISQKEWDSMTAFLRMSHKDDETEAWIKTKEENFGAKLEQNASTPYHLEMARGKLPEGRLGLLQKSWDQGSLEIKERMATTVRLASDLLYLIQGKYDDIQDPEGYLQRMLSSPDLAILELKTVMTTDLVTSGLSRFIGKEAQQAPVDLPGVLLTVGEFVVPSIEAATRFNTHAEEILVPHKDGADPTSGDASTEAPTPVDFYPLLDPALEHGALVHPATILAPFTLGGRVSQGQYSGFDPQDSLLQMIQRKIAAAIKKKFGDTIKVFWSGQEVTTDEFLRTLFVTMGASKLKSRAQQLVTLPVGLRMMGPAAREAWRRTESIKIQRTKRLRRNMRTLLPQFKAGFYAKNNYLNNILPGQQNLLTKSNAAGRILARQKQMSSNGHSAAAESAGNVPSGINPRAHRLPPIPVQSPQMSRNAPLGLPLVHLPGGTPARSQFETDYWRNQPGSQMPGKGLAPGVQPTIAASTTTPRLKGPIKPGVK